MTGRAEFLGVVFDLLPFDAVERWLAGRDAASRLAYVVTPNVDHVVRLPNEGEAVARAYADADLCLCDSRVLARLAKICGMTLPVVPGSDLVAALVARVLRPGDRVCLIGGSTADADALRALHPALEIAHHCPPMGLRTDIAARRRAADAAVAAAARVTLLAIGSPQQELLAHEIAARGNARGTMLCIGASVDFLIGTQRRAPAAWRSMGMEWLWRLATNPRRMARRYLIEGPAIVPMTWRWCRRSLRERA